MQQEPKIGEYTSLEMRVWLLERRVQRLHGGLDNIDAQLKDLSQEVSNLKTQMYKSFFYIAIAVVASNFIAFYF
tara:strand:- start:2662 stop:2883 length:222 start_codon:yes stop_codon:yes gene_type:complete